MQIVETFISKTVEERRKAVTEVIINLENQRIQKEEASFIKTKDKTG